MRSTLKVPISNLRPLWKDLNQTKAGTLTEDSLNHPLYKQILEKR